MKTIFKTLALGLLLIAVASCEKHDPFDENTITGAVGPEAYWTIESSYAVLSHTGTEIVSGSRMIIQKRH